MDEHHSWSNGSVWHIHWPYQEYAGQWPIFYGSAILLHILKTIWWRNVVLGLMDHCDSNIDLVKYMWVSDLYFMVHWFYLISLSDNLFLYIKKWHRLKVFVPLWALALVLFFSFFFLLILFFLYFYFILISGGSINHYVSITAKSGSWRFLTFWAFFIIVELKENVLLQILEFFIIYLCSLILKEPVIMLVRIFWELIMPLSWIN